MSEALDEGQAAHPSLEPASPAYEVAIKLRDVMHFMAGFEVAGSGLGCDGQADVSVRFRGKDFAIRVELLEALA